MHKNIKIVFLIGAAALYGCAAGNPAGWQSWAARHGGLAPQDVYIDRVQAICAELRDGWEGSPLVAHVLDTDAVCAYAFDSGDVFVTRGMITRCTDEELAAALAHEMGHLASHGNRRTAASVRGQSVTGDEEVQADAIGCQILLKHGSSPAAMRAMLQVVGDANPVSRNDVQRRISLLAGQ